MTIVSSGSSHISAIALRLAPGSDVREELDHYASEKGLSGAVTGAVGSLSTAKLRFAGASEPTELNGPFEILTLSGTLSPDGGHLHIALADSRGTLIGGHLLPGSTVHTTLELIVLLFPDLAFSRSVDTVTGCRELEIRPLA